MSLTLGASPLASLDSERPLGLDVNAFKESSRGLILTIALAAIVFSPSPGPFLSEEFAAGSTPDASSVAFCDGEDTVRRQESALVRPKVLSNFSPGG